MARGGTPLSRLSTRRNVISVILALLLSGMLASAVLATASYDTNCSSGRICNYENRDLVVPLAATTTEDQNYAGEYYPNTVDSLNDSVSSTVNYLSSNKVIWYSSSGFSGTSFCVPPNTAATWVGLFYNDTFSSHIIAVGTTCP